MQLRLDEDDAVQELGHDLVLVRVVRLANLLELNLRLLVDGGLRGLSVSSVLSRNVSDPCIE